MTSTHNNNVPELTRLLARGVQALEVSVSEEGQAALLEFIALLHKWNRVYNLTAVVSLRDMVVRHLLESLALAPRLRGPRVLDVGAGPSLPGIPLAIARPDLHFVLLDLSVMMTRFVTHIFGELILNYG